MNAPRYDLLGAMRDIALIVFVVVYIIHTVG